MCDGICRVWVGAGHVDNGVLSQLSALPKLSHNRARAGYLDTLAA
jgi:hypothetical protein